MWVSDPDWIAFYFGCSFATPVLHFRLTKYENFRFKFRMGSSDLNQDHEPETVEIEQNSSESGATMSDLLRHLRVRRYQQETTLQAPPSEDVEEQQAREETSDGSLLSETEAVAPVDEEADQEVDQDDAGGEDFNLATAVDEMGQEVRRMGRELFKTNRAAERNQELFVESLSEIRQLASVIAQIPEQSNESLKDVRFEAKAEMCRDLLRMADTIEASLAAADDLLNRLEARSPHNARAFIFHFHSAKRLRESLVESVAALRQWREGQQLLAERLRAILQTAGVRAIESAGRAFDPALHRAVSTAQRLNVPSGTVIGEELKGYTLEGRILRYAEVIVAKNE